MADNNLEGICKLAELRKMRGDDLYLCSGCYGKAPELPAPFLAEGDVCIATTFITTGHANPEVYSDTSKMAGCEHYLTSD